METDLFMHFFVGDGRVTMAINSKKNDPVVHFGLALSSPKDNFNRAKGRKVASGRLHCQRDPKNGSPRLTGRFERTLDKPIRQEVARFLDCFLRTTPNLPRWAKDGLITFRIKDK